MADERVNDIDAKNQLNRLLTDVKAGSRIISNDGEPVAELIRIAARRGDPSNRRICGCLPTLRAGNDVACVTPRP